MLIGFHLGTCCDRVGDRVGDQAHRGAGRERVGAAAQVLLEDVVLGRALERRLGHPLVFGGDDVEGQQPGGGGVDRHRGVHLVQRDVLEQGPHVALVGDRDAHLAHLAPGQLVVGVVAGLGRQIEGDRQAGLALLEVAPVELVGAPGVRMPCICAHHPGPVGLGKARGRCIRHSVHCMAGATGRRATMATDHRCQIRAQQRPSTRSSRRSHGLSQRCLRIRSRSSTPTSPPPCAGTTAWPSRSTCARRGGSSPSSRPPAPRRPPCGAPWSVSVSRSRESCSARTRPRSRSRPSRGARRRTGSSRRASRRPQIAEPPSNASATWTPTPTGSGWSASASSPMRRIWPRS